MPQKSIVVFVHEAVQDRRLNLAADATVRTDRRPGADVRSKQLRAATDMARTLNPREWLNDRSGLDRDRSLPRVEHHERINLRRRIDFDLRDISHDGDLSADHGRASRPRHLPRSEPPQLEINPQLLGV